MTFDEIRKKSKLSKPTVRQHLDYWVKGDRLVSKRGVYAIPKYITIPETYETSSWDNLSKKEQKKLHRLYTKDILERLNKS